MGQRLPLLQSSCSGSGEWTMGRLKGMRVFLSLAALLAAAIGAPATTAADSPDAQTATIVLNANRDRAIQFRRSFGLASDVATVARTMIDPSLDATTFGIALTRSELEEVNRQIEATNALVPLLEEAAADPDYFGSFLDVRTTNLTIVTSGSPSGFASRLSNSPPAGLSVSFATAPATLVAVQRLRDRIVTDRFALADLGV